MRDLRIRSGGSSQMKLIRLSNAKIVRNMDIDRETVHMRPRRKTVFYVEKILTTHFRAMKRHVLSVTR